MEEQLFAERPDTLRQVRACKSCKLLKTAAQFHAHFCDNCSHEHPETQNAAARSDYVETRTTADCERMCGSFSLGVKAASTLRVLLADDGICSLLQSQGSWVATQLDMRAGDPERTPLKPGVYAITLPREEAYAAVEEEEEEDDEAEKDDEGDESAGEDDDDDADGSKGRAAAPQQEAGGSAAAAVVGKGSGSAGGMDDGESSDDAENSSGDGSDRDTGSKSSNAAADDD